MKKKIKSLFAGLGVGTIAAGAAFSWPIATALDLGFDHLKPTLDKQSYYLRSLFSRTYPDVVVLYACDWITAGNFITLENQLNFGAPNSRIENDMKLVSVSYNNEVHAIPEGAESKQVRTEFGEFIFFKSGFYAYVSFQESPETHHKEIISINLANDSGYKESADLNISTYVTERTANKMADYGNQTSGANTVNAGDYKYQTPLADGSILFGYTKDDNLIGSYSSDVIRGWSGDDNVRGLDGDDVILGEHGSNRLEGGRGADVFVFHPDKFYHQSTFDTVLDFNPAEGDVLNFSDPIEVAYKGLETPPLKDIFFSSSNDNYLDIFVKPQSGQGEEEFSHIVRVMGNSEFDPMSVNIFSMISLGNIQY